MSAASEDRLLGLKEQAEIDGEALVFRRRSITGTVDWGLDAAARMAGRIDFTERTQTVIELLKTATSSIPKADEHFIDQTGWFHRIQLVKATDNTYICQCIATEPEA